MRLRIGWGYGGKGIPPPGMQEHADLPRESGGGKGTRVNPRTSLCAGEFFRKRFCRNVERGQAGASRIRLHIGRHDLRKILE